MPVLTLPRPSARPVVTNRSAKPARPLSANDFTDFKDLGFDTPQLILGIRVPDTEFTEPETQRTYQFKEGRKWFRISHRGAVTGGRPRRYHATILQPRNIVVRGGLGVLHHEWRGIAQGPYGGPTLLTANLYANRIHQLFGVHCDESYRELADGHYPIDLASIGLMAASALPANRLPADVDDLLNWDGGFQRANGALGRWSLAVLA